MMTILIALLAGLQPQAAPEQPTPVRRPVLAEDKDYRAASAPEQEFEGKLDINPGTGKLGLPARFHAFRLIGIEDGKPNSRPLFAEGKDELLGAYVGRRIKLRGKVVETEVEGKKISELWPGELLAVLGDASDTIGEIKVLARTSNWLMNRRQVQPQAYVVRDGVALAQLASMAGPGAEQVAVNQLAQRLEPKPGAMGIPGIDWKKQMVVIISGGVRPSGGARIEVTRLVLLENGLDIHWKLTTQLGGANLPPTETMLIPRYDGEVRFHQDGVRQPIVIPAAAADKGDKPAPAAPAGK